MQSILYFYLAMAMIIGIIFYFGYRTNKKNEWRREENTPSNHDPLDPRGL